MSKLEATLNDLTISIRRDKPISSKYFKTFLVWRYKATLTVRQRNTEEFMKTEFPFTGSVADYKNDVDPSPLEALRNYVLNARSYADHKKGKDAFDVFRLFGYGELDLPILDMDISKALGE